MVDPAALSPDPEKTGVRTGLFLAGVVLLVAAAPAVAAANLGGSCDSVARELKSIDIPVEILTVDMVDHMPEDHVAVDPVIGHEHDPTAPLLFLTPRVAHILEDVFGEAEAEAETKPGKPTPMERVRQIMLAANAANKAQALRASPEASAGGGDADAGGRANFDGADPAISSGPLAETFYDVDTLPRFQRRMYRNDI